MEPIYIETAAMLKAISDPKRLRIVDMLSCGEKCACKLLESFKVTQPTLSHDMRVLVDSGLVKDRREGKNTYYALDEARFQMLIETLNRITTPKADCICNQEDGCK